MLKMTGIKLELMTDVDMFQFIENGMRGGISYNANRHGEANNKYMKEYDEGKPSRYIHYLDANNLYGWAMSQCLPTGGFKLLKNSAFGKTMENIRKRVDVRLVTDQKKLSRLVSKPTYVKSKIFNENLEAVH